MVACVIHVQLERHAQIAILTLGLINLEIVNNLHGIHHTQYITLIGEALIFTTTMLAGMLDMLHLLIQPQIFQFFHAEMNY